MTFAVLREQTTVALRSIRAQWLRTLLTITIIGTGIMALMSMITATEALRTSLLDQFIGLGAGTLQVSQRTDRGTFGGRRLGDSDPLEFSQAMALKKAMVGQAETAVSARGTMMGRLSTGEKETDPNVFVVGGDEGFMPDERLHPAGRPQFHRRRSPAQRPPGHPGPRRGGQALCPFRRPH